MAKRTDTPSAAQDVITTNKWGALEQARKCGDCNGGWLFAFLIANFTEAPMRWTGVGIGSSYALYYVGQLMLSHFGIPMPDSATLSGYASLLKGF